MKLVKVYWSSLKNMSSSLLTRGAVDGPGSEVSPMLTFSPASYAFTRMPKVCISSKTDSNTGTFGGVVAEEVAGIVELVKMVKVSGTETVWSEV